MSPPTYYFVNSTRKEFCSFDDRLPVLQALTQIVHKHAWVMEDDIKVETELSDSTFLIEYLTNEKEYKDLDQDFLQDLY